MELRMGFAKDMCMRFMKKFVKRMILKSAAFYLCGWKNMIDEAKQRIQALGFDRKAIHQELYG